MEKWPSGRRRMFGEHVIGQPVRGFESLFLRCFLNLIIKSIFTMKKIVALIGVFTLLFFSGNVMYGQGSPAAGKDSTVVQNDSTQQTAVQETAKDTTEEATAPTDVPDEANLHYQIKQKFIEGGAGFMATILLALIFGLALAIERILYLNLASINTKKFVEKVEDTLQSDGIDAVMELSKNTRGPIASIFYQGFSRYKENKDIELVEKAVMSYGSVQMGLMEKGLSWISLFIALAPMLGFLGTVIGMIQAFDAIQAAGDISPTLVASGIKVALITTVFGLVVAIILQIFYNYIVSKIDTIVNHMEDASITLLDLLVKYNAKN